MANLFVQNIIEKIKTDFGLLKRIGDGNSLYEISSNGALIYFRYSKEHAQYQKAWSSVGTNQSRV